MKLFGFEIKRESAKELVSFAEPTNEEGAVTVGGALGGAYGTMLDMEGSAATEAELVTRYRKMAMEPEINIAVEDIVNDAINVGEDNTVVDVVCDEIDYSDKVKEKISEEFQNILSLLDFSNNAYDIFSKWYVDGRLNYHIMVDEENPREGIKELRYLDPRKIRLIREVDDREFDKSGIRLKKLKNEYYMYSELGFQNAVASSTASVSGYRIAKDSIARVTSGVLNENNTAILSYLHKAIKPLNQLRMLEDATVIYTLTRAPERRVFYIDVGNLPKARAEQYLHEMMVRHKNKLVYDVTTGETRDDRKMMTMTEDFWFPRREGSRGTEIDTLPAGTGLGDNDNLAFFQRKLYKSLNVPTSRIDNDAMFSLGRASEISRDEVKFAKFIRRLRSKFSVLFDKLLEKQLILKGIISPEDWDHIQNRLRYRFNKDNFFEELKEAEVLRERINSLRDIEEHVGVYFSKEWVRKEILKMSEEDINTMKEQMEEERKEEPPLATDEF